ncbi:MAG: hypothetical protein RBQ91_00810 [Acholeplasma sp.]|nr:hypothetical protein [Acholeplasma sp.]
MKKIMSITLVLLLVLVGCENQTLEQQTPIFESVCKDNPIKESCYTPSYDLEFVDTDKEEYLIEETFETEFLNQMPSNWLIYKNEEYSSKSVWAKVIEKDDNKILQMYSDGINAPMYPQGVAKPSTFVLSSKFNLDKSRKGEITGKIMIPEVEGNEVSFGVSTGAVNTASIIINQQMRLLVKIGGPFFYHSGNNDSGDTIDTGLTLNKGVFHQFTITWDAMLNQITVIYNNQSLKLYEGSFHISSRYNASETGDIYVPNVVRVTMPKGFDYHGFAFLDDVIVSHKEAK